jgi:hypothetical protein
VPRAVASSDAEDLLAIASMVMVRSRVNVGFTREIKHRVWVENQPAPLNDLGAIATARSRQIR